MITGSIKNIDAYKGISGRLDRAIEFAKTFDKSLPCGRYAIEGDALYANLISGTTGDLSDVVFEAHRKYLDLHLILEGGETLVYAPIENGDAASEYDEDGDVRFFVGSGTPIELKAGDFCILHPFDLHAPSKGDKPTEFKKLIVKILI